MPALCLDTIGMVQSMSNERMASGRAQGPVLQVEKRLEFFEI